MSLKIQDLMKTLHLWLSAPKVFGSLHSAIVGGCVRRISREEEEQCTALLVWQCRHYESF